MSRGGFRPGSGSGGARPGAGRPRKQPKLPSASRERALPAPAENLDPLEYLLRVMNDPASPQHRRDRAAIAAAPYVHGKVGEKGKKEAKNEAAAASRRFPTGKPPPPRSVN